MTISCNALRFTFTAVGSGATIVLNEINLAKADGTSLNDGTHVSGVTATTTDAGSALALVDGNPGALGWVSNTLPVSVVMSFYTLESDITTVGMWGQYGSSSLNDRAPKTWTVERSLDSGTTWTQVLNVVNDDTSVTYGGGGPKNFALALAGAAFTAGTATAGSTTSTTAAATATEATGGSGAITHQWYGSTSTGFTPGSGNLLSGQTSLTLAATGLTPSTPYFFKHGYTQGGTTVYSNQITETTASGGSGSLTVSGTAGAGTVGSAYATTFTATGGTGTLVYSVGSGELPGGVTLNTATGALTGTPTAAGTFTFVIHAHDSTSGTPLVGNSGSQSVSISAQGHAMPNAATAYTNTAHANAGGAISSAPAVASSTRLLG